MTIYFITMLIVLNLQPPLGWIQHTFPYDNKEICLSYIAKYKDEIALSVGKQFGNLLLEIKEFDCVTREDAVNRNTKLGH